MQLLNKAANFSKAKNDLKNINITFIRSIIEQSAVVWHRSLSKKNRRVQKSAVRVIMGDSYRNYKHGLKILKIETLDKRRDKLCLSFAKKCFKKEKSNFPPKNSSKHNMKKRKRMKTFKPKKTNTERNRKSSIPYMINLLNKEFEKKNVHLEEN